MREPLPSLNATLITLLLLFSSNIERDAAFPEGIPDGVPTAITGVSIVDAAIGTARVVAEHRPEWMVFVGTCGAHAGRGLDVGDIVVASEALLGSGDVARGEMRLPGLVAGAITPDAGLADRIVEAGARLGREVKRARVSTTLGITENDELAGLLASGADVENLEAYSIVRAAGDIPAAVLLGVTNIVGPGGGRYWRENFGALMQAATAVALVLERVMGDEL